MPSLYALLMRHCRLWITANRFHHLTWCKAICKCQHMDAFWFVIFRIQFMPHDGDVFRGPAVCHLVIVLWWCMHLHSQWWWNVRMVFKRLKDFNLKIKLKKCLFFQCSLVFLGYVLSVDGIYTNPEKVEILQNWPISSSQKELPFISGLSLLL